MLFFYWLTAYCFVVFFFFFQAEDGIRDLTVTGVQTCALPISSFEFCQTAFAAIQDAQLGDSIDFFGGHKQTKGYAALITVGDWFDHYSQMAIRSEERRVGKECRSRWSPYH